MKWTEVMFNLKSVVAAGLALAGVAFAAETLFSNYALNVNASSETGKLWVFSRGDLYSGATLLTLTVGGDGSVRVKESSQGQVSDSVTAVQDRIFRDELAERRRTPSVLAGRLGYVLPMYGMNDEELYARPEGILSVRGVDDIYETPLVLPSALEDAEEPMDYAVSGFAYDASAKRLWMARGTAGLGLYDDSKSSSRDSAYFLDTEKKTLDKKYNKKSPSIFAVALHPETNDLWMATSKGMWIRSSDGSVRKASTVLDSTRVTGVWIGGEPLQVLAETSYKKGESLKGALWRLKKGAKDFAKVSFLDTDGKKVKKDVYDDGDYTVNGVAFLDRTAFVAVGAAGTSVSGYFKLDTAGIRAWDVDDKGKNYWLYGYETGATDRDNIITSICAFPLTKDVTGLAIATYGNGIAVSANGGESWSQILNRAPLGNNLGSVRMVPSVITAGDQSLVSYKVDKDAKVTIDVFSYDMKKVRTIVKDASRTADNSRSTDPKEDFWDGYDKAGRPCTMGVYYVRVKDNHDNVGWGKVMTLGGHK